MSYQEKRTIVSTITGALILAAYCIYAFGNYSTAAAGPDELRTWAITILAFIGIGILASIIIQIIFHILLSISIAVQHKIEDSQFDDKQIEKSINAEMVEDEMGKLIELKSMRVGFFFAGTGFVAALLALVFRLSPVIMLNIIFISFTLGSLIEGLTQLYYFRRGIANG